jgi:uncharacterized membrane protein YeaQ/YmgE (transglycosylase-associated protein family)
MAEAEALGLANQLLNFKLHRFHSQQGGLRNNALQSGGTLRYILCAVVKGGWRMGILVSLLVGLVAGWLAGQVMKGGGYGVLVDILLGLLGGIIGGWLFGMLGLWPGGGILGSIIVSFVGAVILVWITRLIKRA